MLVSKFFNYDLIEKKTFMLHSRMHGFLLTELSVWKASSSKLQFEFERAAIKTQHLANI